ncbi:hypothetical protein DPMN_124584 [Dreissena polymorpha]|uniref:Uncharacterized protein n=1 Tax=Dreissena polymorpha TaxID=45954 RepID=A0A9D4GVV8_DREPO|nr:hypothetical protein DPMN_124584 [Dreissena polymorpha]
MTLTCKALQGQSPAYIKDMIDVYRPTRNLRSAHQSMALVPSKSKEKYGKGASNQLLRNCGTHCLYMLETVKHSSVSKDN